jgi:hypothetical protein
MDQDTQLWRAHEIDVFNKRSDLSERRTKNDMQRNDSTTFTLFHDSSRF